MSATGERAVLHLAEQLFGAIERSDVAAVAQLFGPDVRVWKSGDRRDNDRDRSLRIISWFIDSTVERRYQILDRHLFPGGFVQQHILHATTGRGGVLAMRVCIVIKIDSGGLISRIDEYFDPAELAPLVRDSS